MGIDAVRKFIAEPNTPFLAASFLVGWGACNTFSPSSAVALSRYLTSHPAARENNTDESRLVALFYPKEIVSYAIHSPAGFIFSECHLLNLIRKVLVATAFYITSNRSVLTSIAHFLPSSWKTAKAVQTVFRYAESPQLQGSILLTLHIIDLMPVWVEICNLGFDLASHYMENKSPPLEFFRAATEQLGHLVEKLWFARLALIAFATAGQFRSVIAYIGFHEMEFCVEILPVNVQSFVKMSISCLPWLFPGYFPWSDIKDLAGCAHTAVWAFLKPYASLPPLKLKSMQPLSESIQNLWKEQWSAASRKEVVDQLRKAPWLEAAWARFRYGSILPSFNFEKWLPLAQQIHRMDMDVQESWEQLERELHKDPELDVKVNPHLYEELQTKVEKYLDDVYNDLVDQKFEKFAAQEKKLREVYGDNKLSFIYENNHPRFNLESIRFSLMLLMANLIRLKGSQNLNLPVIYNLLYLQTKECILGDIEKDWRLMDDIKSNYEALHPFSNGSREQIAKESFFIPLFKMLEGCSGQNFDCLTNTVLAELRGVQQTEESLNTQAVQIFRKAKDLYASREKATTFTLSEIMTLANSPPPNSTTFG